MLQRIAKIVLIIAIFMAAAGISTYLTVHMLIRSKNTVVVPDLTGKEVVLALELLSDLGLNTKVKTSAYSNSVPRHHIISQDPEPGVEIKTGRDVRLTISKGAQTVVVPNLVGINGHQVSLYLSQNGLLQGQISYCHSEVNPKDDVMAQYPTVGAVAKRGDLVDLLISTGSQARMFAMIDLRGLSLGQAIETAETSHLNIRSINSKNIPGLPDETIVEQTPPAGYPTSVGDGVDIVINRKQMGTDSRNAANSGFFNFTLNQGLLNTHVKVILNRPAFSLELFNAFIKPGSRIWLLVPEGKQTTLLLYLDDELASTFHYD